MLALSGCKLSATVARSIGVKFEHGLTLDHHPCDPSVSNGEEQEKPHNGACAQVDELDPESERKEHACGENVNRPLNSHGNIPLFCGCWL